MTIATRNKVQSHRNFRNCWVSSDTHVYACQWPHSLRHRLNYLFKNTRISHLYSIYFWFFLITSSTFVPRFTFVGDLCWCSFQSVPPTRRRRPLEQEQTGTQPMRRFDGATYSWRTLAALTVSQAPDFGLQGELQSFYIGRLSTPEGIPQLFHQFLKPQTLHYLEGVRTSQLAHNAKLIKSSRDSCHIGPPICM